MRPRRPARIRHRSRGHAQSGQQPRLQQGVDGKDQDKGQNIHSFIIPDLDQSRTPAPGQPSGGIIRPEPTAGTNRRNLPAEPRL